MGAKYHRTKRRARKAYLKHYKHTGVDKFKLTDNTPTEQGGTGGVFRNQDRLSSLGRPDDGIRNARDYHDVPATKGISEPKKDVVSTLHQLWTSELRGQGVNRYYCEVVLNGMFRMICLYFSSELCFFVEFAKENQQQTPTRRSITYRNRETALRQYGYGKVTWVTPVP